MLQKQGNMRRTHALKRMNLVTRDSQVICLYCFSIVQVLANSLSNNTITANDINHDDSKQTTFTTVAAVLFPINKPIQRKDSYRLVLIHVRHIAL